MRQEVGEESSRLKSRLEALVLMHSDVQTFEDQIAREMGREIPRLEEHLAPSGEGFQRLPDDSGHSSPAFYK